MQSLPLSDIRQVKPPGVVIVGGAHGTLALARSLGARKVPVWLVSNDTPLPGWSRYVAGKIEWAGANAPDAADALVRLAAERGLRGSLLIAGGDNEVRLVSQSRDRLAEAYALTLPDWQRLKWLVEKPLLYRKAAELGIGIPATYRFASVEEADGTDIRFPVVLKPNMGGGDNRFSRAKVVRADDRASFDAAFRDAVGQIGIDNVVVQQLIPGGGDCQLSYAALWHAGKPVGEFTARRRRQYPVDFGYTSTFVDVVDEPVAADAARRLLSAVEFAGLVEIEFKRDPRDGALKLLDVNPRPWSWFGLSAAAGADFGAMLWDMSNARPVSPATARIGTAWTYLVRDVVASGILMKRGVLGPGEFLRSLGAVRAWATFSASDPLPGFVDIPLTAWRVLTRRILR